MNAHVKLSEESVGTEEILTSEAMLAGGDMFRLLTSAIRDAIIVVSPSGRLAFWNQAAGRMFDYDLDDMPDQEILHCLVPERFRDLYRDRLCHFPATDDTPLVGRTQEMVMQRRDGTEILVEVSLSGIKLLGQSHVLGVIRDITERRLAEAELAKDRNLLRALVENADELIYFKDLQSRFVWCSAAQIKWFHNCTSMDDIIGKTDHDFFAVEHADKALEDEQKIIETGEPITGKVEKETWPDGRITWVLTNKMPFRNEAA